MSPNNTLPPSMLTLEATSCADTDNGAKDKYGGGCVVYKGHTGWCGLFDNSDFDSMQMCCVCGGGMNSGNIS